MKLFGESCWPQSPAPAGPARSLPPVANAIASARATVLRATLGHLASLRPRRGWTLAALLLWPAGAFAEEGLRRIDSPRFGVAVMAPGGWRLIEWSENAKAFVLRLPQERSSADGFVRCELGPAPERLADFQRLHLAINEREQRSGDAQRKLLSDDLESPAGAVEGQRLVTVWELLDEHARHPDEKRFEVAARLVRDDTLYTFTLITDEAHFAAYRADFDDLVAGAKITPPDSGLTAAPGGYWTQPQFQFAMCPPAGWKPAFGPSDRALWCARGAAHGLFADQLTVAASPSAPLNLLALRDSVAETLVKTRPEAELISCQIVRQGNGSALETVVRAEQEGASITVIERRFAGARRNYDIRAACETGSFKRQEAEIRKALDSFGELADEAGRPAL